jgi:hypothetical protein
MSQTMKDKPAKNSLPVHEPGEELSGAEKLVDSLRPHSSSIALGLALLFLVFVVATYFIKSNMDRNEDQWRLMNNKIAEVGITGNTSGLKEVIEEFPDGTAGLWALQLAGDYDLRQGISELAQDRAAGIKTIEKARDSLQKIVDAPAASKNTMLQRRSTYSLAYANESLGKFAQAEALYQQIVDGAPESAFGKAAKRGIERTSNPVYVALYEKFSNWDDSLAEAPGPPIPTTPDISFKEFDEIDLPDEEANDDSESTDSGSTDSAGGDFESNIDGENDGKAARDETVGGDAGDSKPEE